MKKEINRTNKNRYEAIIIGGGISGCFTAYFLIKRGFNTLLIEKERYPTGASARSGGIITRMMDNFLDRSLACRSIQLYREIFDDNGEVINSGYLSIESNEDAYYDYNKFKEGIPNLEILEPKEIKDSWDYIKLYENEVGLYAPDDITIDPFKMITNFWEKLLDMGITILKPIKVLNIRSEGKIADRIELSNGEEMRGEFFVLTSGAWNSEILLKMGISIGVWLIGIPIFKFVVDNKEKIGVWDEKMYSYWRPGGKTSWIGGVYDAFRINRPEIGLSKPDNNSLQNAIGGFKYRFDFRKWSLLDAWSGPVSIPSNYKPIYGRVDDFSNLYIIDGLGGRGLMRGPAIAEKLVNKITKKGDTYE